MRLCSPPARPIACGHHCGGRGRTLPGISVYLRQPQPHDRPGGHRRRPAGRRHAHMQSQPRLRRRTMRHVCMSALAEDIRTRLLLALPVTGAQCPDLLPFSPVSDHHTTYALRTACMHFPTQSGYQVCLFPAARYTGSALTASPPAPPPLPLPLPQAPSWQPAARVRAVRFQCPALHVQPRGRRNAGGGEWRARLTRAASALPLAWLAGACRHAWKVI